MVSCQKFGESVYHESAAFGVSNVLRYGCGSTVEFVSTRMFESGSVLLPLTDAVGSEADVKVAEMVALDCCKNVNEHTIWPEASDGPEQVWPSPSVTAYVPASWL